MNLSQALNEFGFKPDYKPTKEEIKKEYKILARFFHPDSNPTETDVATEMMRLLNQSLEVITNNLDVDNTWNIGDFIYTPEKSFSADYYGYKGKIRLSGGTLYQVNRELTSQEGIFEGEHTIGFLLNQYRPYSWYLVLEGDGDIDDVCDLFDSDSHSFEIGLNDFLMKYCFNTNRERIYDVFIRGEITDNWHNVEFCEEEGLVKVRYEEQMSDLSYGGERRLKRETSFTLEEMSLLERISLEEHQRKMRKEIE